jgi:hypothetical protein
MKAFSPTTTYDEIDEINRRYLSDSKTADTSLFSVTIEVGQTLFEPITHPGFLEGKEMIAGRLVTQCGASVSTFFNVFYDM